MAMNFEKINTLEVVTSKVNELDTKNNHNIYTIARLVSIVEEKELYKDLFKSTAQYVSETFGYTKGYTSLLLRVGRFFLREVTDTKGNTKYYETVLAKDGKDYTFSKFAKIVSGFETIEEVENFVSENNITFNSTAKDIENARKKMNGKETVEETVEEEVEETVEEPVEETVEETVEEEEEHGVEIRIGGKLYRVPMSVLEKYEVKE